MNFFVPLLIGASHGLNLRLYNIKDKNIENYLKVLFNNNNKWNVKRCRNYSTENKEISDLNSYLAGLFEGDGHIILSGKEDFSVDDKDDKEVPDITKNVNAKYQFKKVIIGITFNIKDLPLCNHLKMIIGHGWIRIKSKENACVLTLHTDSGVLKFVELINGYLRSPKLYKFNLVVDYLNKKYKLNIRKNEVDESDINCNSGFTGFVDADGGF